MPDLMNRADEELTELLEEVFTLEAGEASCGSLWGCDGLGKTALVNQYYADWKDNEHPNVYCFTIDMREIAEQNEAGYKEFWKKVVSGFQQQIAKEQLECAATKSNEETVSEVLALYNELLNTSLQCYEVGNKMDTLFRKYTKLGIHVILLIDNFEEAARVFPIETDDGKFFSELFSLTPKAHADLNLSILLISRRHVEDVAHHMQKGSTFISAYPSTRLNVFKNSEMDDFYRSLPIEVNDTIKGRIEYYCGNHPGLLVTMRKMISEHPEEARDIDALFKQYGCELKLFYENQYQILLREVYASVTEEDLKIESLLTLFQKAYMSDCELREKRSCALKVYMLGMAMRYDAETYAPISQYFIDYVAERVSQ